jgi:hypothetical protein
MKRTGVVLGVIGAVVAASGACTSSGTSGSSSSSDGGGDGGGCSTCTVSDGGLVDSGPPGDSASSGDAADAAPACNLHLRSGFSLAIADPGASIVETGAPGSRTAAMVLDENDDPMFAWSSYPGGASTTVTIYFSRWDACAGAFTTPLVVTRSTPDRWSTSPSGTTLRPARSTSPT